MTSEKDYDSVAWTEYFYLDSASESGLRWAVFNRAIHPKSKRYVGDVAGFKKKLKNGDESYYRVKLNGNNYAVHRILWTMAFGPIPTGFVINHIDNNIFNNSLDNLEVCPREVNMRRRKDHTGVGLSKANTSGVTGVAKDIKWNKEKTRSVTYIKAFASLLDGTHAVKCFRIDKHGEEEALRLAIEWRDDKIAELNELGAGYSTIT